MKGKRSRISAANAKPPPAEETPRYESSSPDSFWTGDVRSVLRTMRRRDVYGLPLAREVLRGRWLSRRVLWTGSSTSEGHEVQRGWYGHCTHRNGTCGTFRFGGPEPRRAGRRRWPLCTSAGWESQWCGLDGSSYLRVCVPSIVAVAVKQTTLIRTPHHGSAHRAPSPGKGGQPSGGRQTPLGRPAMRAQYEAPGTRPCGLVDAPSFQQDVRTP